jgi:hypothetical protein
MSALLYGLVIGVLIGGVAAFSLGIILPKSYSVSYGKFLVKQGLRQGDRWVLEQQETDDYELVHISHDKDLNAEVTDDDLTETDVYKDPGGLMGRMFGRPFGIAFERSKVITSPFIAKAGELEEEKERNETRADGVGKVVGWTDDGTPLVNPYGVLDDDDRHLVDVSAIMKLLEYSGEPDTASKAATEAKQSEAMREGRSQLVQNASIIGAAMTGGILVYLGTSGGGGGGGGGGSVLPFMIQAVGALLGVA